MADSDDGMYGYDDDEELDISYESESSENDGYQLENLYYNGKNLKVDSTEEAIAKFQEAITAEKSSGELGEWGFKCHKQICKILFKLARFSEFVVHYENLLDYIHSAVNKNYADKSINNILNYISIDNITPNLGTLQKQCYGLTLRALEKTPNERLWFKAYIKFGKLRLLLREFDEVKKIVTKLYDWIDSKSDKTDSTNRGSQLLEIYALDIQMCTEIRDTKELKKLYNSALAIKSAISHPLNQGIIKECGGKMHLREMNYESARTDFFEAFKSFDESGSFRRINCLKYLVLTSMLCQSDINVFDSQEAKSHRFHADIIVITELLQSYQDRDCVKFDKVISSNIASLKIS